MWVLKERCYGYYGEKSCWYKICRAVRNTGIQLWVLKNSNPQTKKNKAQKLWESRDDGSLTQTPVTGEQSRRVQRRRTVSSRGNKAVVTKRKGSKEKTVEGTLATGLGEHR